MQPGTRLGRYEILQLIGSGGMGEVWKAVDTTLRREVAIKSLPSAFADDADRLARLDREARLLATLNHPNIAAIYGLEETTGSRFLVLELISGQTLADRLERGPLPIREALTIALQIADSLEAAHEKGVIHRDLKPANIKVTPEGRVKVLDFGIAKSLEAGRGTHTESLTLTEAGALIGTPAYMSPEQARGEEAGRQADIWSFGAVLYELLTGTSPFSRRTAAATIAQVMLGTPDFADLPADTPASVRRLLRRCFERDTRRRWHDMGDVRVELEDALSSDPGDADIVGSPGQAAAAWARSHRFPLAAGAVVVIGLAMFSGRFLVPRSMSGSAPSPVHSMVSFPESPATYSFGVRRVAITNDGSRMVYASYQRLWTRRVDQSEVVALQGQPEIGGSPFVSPDGRWIAIFRDLGLFKVPIEGGRPVLIAPMTERHVGGTWRADGTIVFSTTEGLHQVSADGGEVRLLLKPDQTRRHFQYSWPHFMPDGRSLLITIAPENPADGFKIALLDLRTLELIDVLEGGSSAQYLPSGYIVYAAGQTLRAVAFDYRARRTIGDPFNVPGIQIEFDAANGAADFVVSPSGTLAFLPPLRLGARIPMWLDRQGKQEPIAVTPGAYASPGISPDGKRALLDQVVNGNRDQWILDLERPSVVQLTDGPNEDMLPVWAPDGRRVYFGSNRTGNIEVYSQPADGATGPRLEFAGPGVQLPQEFAPDGSALLVYEDFRDIKAFRPDRPDRLDTVLSGQGLDFRLPVISRDGNWIAYESNESGQQIEIFVRPWPNVSDRREKISVDGGRYPRWGPAGSNELFYIDLTGMMMAAAVTLSPDLRLGRVEPLFEFGQPPAGRSPSPYDVSPIDGRFLATRRIEPANEQATNAQLIVNWIEELRAIAPTR